MIHKIDFEKQFPALPDLKKTDSEKDPSFKDTLKEAIQQVNELQEDAATMQQQFVTGEVTDLHQVMVAAEKARVALELMLEIRNKMVDAYKEIMRMQV